MSQITALQATLVCAVVGPLAIHGKKTKTKFLQRAEAKLVLETILVSITDTFCALHAEVIRSMVHCLAHETFV